MNKLNENITEFTVEDFATLPGLETLKNLCEQVITRFEHGFPLKRINGFYVETQEILDGFPMVVLEIENSRTQTVRFTYIVSDEFPKEKPYMMIARDKISKMPMHDFWNSLPLI